MSASIAQVQHVSQAIREVLTTTAKAVERSTGFVQRSTAILDGPGFVQTTVFTWMHNPNAGYSQLQHTAAARGLQVSKQAIEQRFDPSSVKLLRHVWQEGITHLISSEPMTETLLSRFNGVYLQDGTIISLPDAMHEQWPAGGGKGERASMRIQVRMQMQTGEIAGAWVQPGQEAERSGEPMQGPLPEGSLFVGDSGYFTLVGMRERSDAKQLFLTSAKAGTQVQDRQGTWRDLLSFLRDHPEEGVDEWITLGKREQVKVRLIAVRVGETQARARRERAKAHITHPPKGIAAPSVGKRTPVEQKQGKRKRKKVSPTRLKLSEWTILVTNVGQDQMSVEEAVVLMRYRWQIELYWKLWKQRGKVDTWRSGNLARLETEVFAKLVGLLLTHWLTLIGCWADPMQSLVKAKEVASYIAPCLTLALDEPITLEQVVQRCVEMMGGSNCRVDTRKRRPSAGQLLENPRLLRGLG